MRTNCQEVQGDELNSLKKNLNCLNDDNLPIPEMKGYIKEKGIHVMACTSGG